MPPKWNCYFRCSNLKISRLPQGRRNGQARRANGGENAAEEADDGGPDDSLYQKARSDGEGESHLTEGLPVHGGGLHAVERKVGNTCAECAAHQRESKGFREDGE